MLRRILPFVAILLYAIPVSAQSKKQIKELKIKSMTETQTLYKDGKETTTYKSDYLVFDKDGNSTAEIEYNPDGSIKRKQTTVYSGKDKSEEITEHPNDQDNNDPPKKYKRITWKYNANGDKTEEVEYNAAGLVVKKTTVAYDSKGNKAFEMEYDGSDRLMQKTAYSYDSKGLKTERKVYGPGDVLIKDAKYTYTY